MLLSNTGRSACEAPVLMLSASYTSGIGAHLGESSSLARISTPMRGTCTLLVGFPSRSPYQLKLKPDADCLVLLMKILV